MDDTQRAALAARIQELLSSSERCHQVALRLLANDLVIDRLFDACQAAEFALWELENEPPAPSDFQAATSDE